MDSAPPEHSWELKGVVRFPAPRMVWVEIPDDPRSPIMRRILLARFVTMLAFLALVASFFAKAGLPLEAGLCLLLVTGPVVWFALRLVYSVVFALLEARGQPQPAPPAPLAPRDVTLRADADGLTFEYVGGQSRYRWHELAPVAAQPDALRIHAPDGVWVVPVQAFADVTALFTTAGEIERARRAVPPPPLRSGDGL